MSPHATPPPPPPPTSSIVYSPGQLVMYTISGTVGCELVSVYTCKISAFSRLHA